MAKTIGIDLGTTNSCVAVLEGTSVQIVPNSIGGRTTPSVVAFTEKGERLVGHIARRQAVTNAANTVYAVKRLMGRRFDAAEIQKLLKYLSYTVTASEKGDARVSVRGKEYSPPEISAMLLQDLKNAAEQFLGEEVRDAIITVPAYFDDCQRQATKDAGRIAGLEVRRIINEPTAAALAYGLGKKDRERVAIFDLGGGTFDVTILELNNGVFEVLSTCGDSFLGGEDFDQRVVDWISAEYQKETGVRLPSDVMTRQRLKEAGEKAKCELSGAAEARIALPFISHDAKGPRHFDRVLSRADFEQLVQDLIGRTTAYCEKALKDAGLTPDQLDNVILVGGQTRMPAVQRHVSRIFGRQPSMEVNPDEVVAIGAALQGGVLQGELKEIVLLDVLPLSLGVETQGGLFTRLIEHNSTIPLKKTTLFTTVADNQSVVEIHVLQGERELAQFNRSLGRFDLVGIAPAPRGVPQIEVTFDIDANGIVSVSARDKISGKEQAIQITPSSGLTKDQIDLMVLEARRHAEADRKLRQIAEARNRIRGQEASLARSYSEFGWLLGKADQEKLKAAVQRAREVASAEDDPQVLNSILADLEESATLLSTSMMNAPETGRRPESEVPETDVQNLMRSALNDLGRKTTKQTSG